MKTFRDWSKENKHHFAKDSLQSVPSSKETISAMHSEKLPKDNDVYRGVTEYQKSSEGINRQMRHGKELTGVEQKAKNAFQQVIGRNSDKFGAATSQSGRVFHGQSYAPTIDGNGHIRTQDFTSWSTNPSDAARFSKSDADHDAHHIFVMNHEHDNDVGHRLFSTVPKNHSHATLRSEQELVSGPAKYAFTKTKLEHPHPDTGKTIYEYHVKPIEMHPLWKANASGALNPSERSKMSNWSKNEKL